MIPFSDVGTFLPASFKKAGSFFVNQASGRFWSYDKNGLTEILLFDGYFSRREIVNLDK